jgi:hypothetical protein
VPRPNGPPEHVHGTAPAMSATHVLSGPDTLCRTLPMPTLALVLASASCSISWFVTLGLPFQDTCRYQWQRKPDKSLSAWGWPLQDRCIFRPRQPEICITHDLQCANILTRPCCSFTHMHTRTWTHRCTHLCTTQAPTHTVRETQRAVRIDRGGKSPG